MLSTPKRRIAAGMGLLAIASLGLAFAGGRWLLLETRHHVVVEISRADGIEQVFIDCHLAARVESGEPSKSVDLGWLEPDDRIFISTTSIDSSPAWDFYGTSNGGFLFHESRGSTTLPRYKATAQAVVFAQAFSAAGAKLGAIGCQAPGAVADDVVDVEGYAWSPDDKEVPETTDTRSSYRRPNDFYDRVDGTGGWSLVALGVLGAVLTIAIGPTRGLIQKHWKWAIGALASLATIAGAFFGVLGPTALITTLTVSGTLLLFAVVWLLLWPPLWQRLEGAAGAGGS